METWQVSAERLDDGRFHLNCPVCALGLEADTLSNLSHILADHANREHPIAEERIIATAIKAP